MKSPMQMSRGRARVRPSGEASSPEVTPSPDPTVAPTEAPEPTEAPTAEPTVAPTEAPTPGPTLGYGGDAEGRLIAAIGKQSYVALVSRFGVPWLHALDDAAAAREARWHGQEDAGFPDGRPSDTDFSKHYEDYHPGLPLPRMPGAQPSARVGRLDASAVRQLGLTPLSDRSPAPGSVYEPAIVTEGAIIEARDGSRWRVVLRGDAFVVDPAPDAGSMDVWRDVDGDGDLDPPTTVISPATSSPVLRVLGGLAIGALAGAAISLLVAAVAPAPPPHEAEKKK